MGRLIVLVVLIAAIFFIMWICKKLMRDRARQKQYKSVPQIIEENRQLDDLIEQAEKDKLRARER